MEERDSGERARDLGLPAAGYESSDERYPMVVVNYGNQAWIQGKWANSLDNLIGKDRCSR